MMDYARCKTTYVLVAPKGTLSRSPGEESIIGPTDEVFRWPFRQLKSFAICSLFSQPPLEPGNKRIDL